MEDDMYQNSGEYFQPTEPEDQAKDRIKQKAKRFDAQGAIKDLIKRFDERIAFYDSMKSIPKEVRGDPDLFLVTVNANDQTAQNLMTERDYLKSLLDE